MTYPFLAEGGEYDGRLPDQGAAWDVRPHRFWLGDPGGRFGMLELPSPDSENYVPTRGRGRIEHGLAANTSAVTRFAGTTRRWSIAWHRLAGFERDVVNGFDSGLFGNGPWCFPAPEHLNRLTWKQSLCGADLGVVEGWTGTVAPVYQPTRPAYVLGGGTMSWAPGGLNRVLAATFDPHYSPPNLVGEPFTWTIWARTLTGTAQAKARVYGRDADGSSAVSVIGPTVTVGTAWAPLIVTGDPLSLGASQYAAPAVVSVDGVALQLSCPLFDYREGLVEWTPGCGVPRVNMVADLDTSADVHLNQPTTMVLAEAWAGAA